MKSISVISAAFLVCCQLGFSEISGEEEAVVESAKQEEVVSSEDSAVLENFDLMDFLNIEEDSFASVTMQFLEGTTVPFTFALKGIEGKEYVAALKVKQGFYIRCVEDEVLFSTDCVNWEDFELFDESCFFSFEMQGLEQLAANQ